MTKLILVAAATNDSPQAIFSVLMVSSCYCRHLPLSPLPPSPRPSLRTTSWLSWRVSRQTTARTSISLEPGMPATSSRAGLQAEASSDNKTPAVLACRLGHLSCRFSVDVVCLVRQLSGWLTGLSLAVLSCRFSVNVTCLVSQLSGWLTGLSLAVLSCQFTVDVTCLVSQLDG